MEINIVGKVDDETVENRITLLYIFKDGNLGKRLRC